MTRVSIATVVFTVATSLASAAGLASADEPAPPTEGEPVPPPEGESPPPETEVAVPDGQAALEGKPDEKPVAAPADVKVGYDKGFFIASESDKGSFLLKITSRVQPGIELTSKGSGDARVN